MQVSCESRAHHENGSGNRTLGVRLGHLTMLSLALTCYNRNITPPFKRSLPLDLPVSRCRRLGPRTRPRRPPTT